MKDVEDRLRFVWLIKLFYFLFTETCPNCESAWTGGVASPESLTFCVVCSNPKTGEIRGWVYRNRWLHRLLVSRHNFRKINSAEFLERIKREYNENVARLWAENERY